VPYVVAGEGKGEVGGRGFYLEIPFLREEVGRSVPRLAGPNLRQDVMGKSRRDVNLAQ